MRDSRRLRVSDSYSDSALELFGHLLKGALEHPELAPDRLIVISLSKQAKHGILTKKRLELLKVLKTKEKEIKSISELAKAVGRSLESVSRDLRVLRSAGLIEFSQDGTTKKPVLTKDLILMPIA